MKFNTPNVNHNITDEVTSMEFNTPESNIDCVEIRFNGKDSSNCNSESNNYLDWNNIQNKPSCFNACLTPLFELFVPLSRTITINGTTYDLSEDRSWTIATSSYTFLNGLTQSAGIVKLGGTLTADTQIDTDTFGITFGNNTTKGLRYNQFNAGNLFLIGTADQDINFTVSNASAGISASSSFGFVNDSTNFGGLSTYFSTGYTAGVYDNLADSFEQKYFKKTSILYTNNTQLNYWYGDPTSNIYTKSLSLYNDKIGIGNYTTPSTDLFSTLNLNGTLSLSKITGSSGNYNLLNTDFFHENVATGGGSTVTVPLSTAVGLGKIYIIKGSRITGGVNTTIQLSGTDQFSGSVGTSSLILTPDQSVMLQCTFVGSTGYWTSYFTGGGSGTGISSFTTTGSSGAATFSAGALNIPTYTLTGLGGFANPMTAVGDMIIGSTAGAAIRLGVGTSGYFLQSNGTNPTYFDLFGTANTFSAQQTFTLAPTFSAMTAGSVLFAGASGVLSQDNGKFTYLPTGYNSNAMLMVNATAGSPTPKASLHVRGSGATSATNAMYVENSSGTQLLRVRDIPTGTTSFEIGDGTFANTTYIDTNQGVATIRTKAITVRTSADTLEITGGLGVGGANLWSPTQPLMVRGTYALATTTNQAAFSIIPTFSPASGSANFAGLVVAPTINQNASATGVTYGIFNYGLTTLAYYYKAISIGLQSAYTPNAAITTYNFSEITPIINASVNSQVITGLDIAMSGSDGAFTGVLRNALRVSGGDINIASVGNGLKIKEGTNATMGTGTLVAGGCTINTTKVTANSRIFISAKPNATYNGVVKESPTIRVVGTSFYVVSFIAGTNTVASTDVSQFDWIIIEPS